MCGFLFFSLLGNNSNTLQDLKWVKPKPTHICIWSANVINKTPNECKFSKLYHTFDNPLYTQLIEAINHAFEVFFFIF